MEIKRLFSLTLGIVGLTLVVFSLGMFQTIVGAVVGVNSTSKYLGIFGVLFMVIAVIIERFDIISNKKN